MARLMYECVEFLEDDNLLQESGRKMGVVIDRKPKCNPELVGEDVEHSYIFSKNAYRRFPIS